MGWSGYFGENGDTFYMTCGSIEDKDITNWIGVQTLDVAKLLNRYNSTIGGNGCLMRLCIMNQSIGRIIQEGWKPLGLRGTAVMHIQSKTGFMAIGD